MAQEAPPVEGEKPAAETPEKPEANTEVPASAQSPKTFDEGYVKELRSEAAASRKARQELEAKLNEYEERDKSELEKAQGKVAKADERAANAEAKLLRYEVASEKEVPAKLVPLLTALTREDLESQADLILENAKPAAPQFDGGTREPAPEPKSPEEAHSSFLAELFRGSQQATP